MKDLSNEVVLEAALVENIQRSDLGPLEAAGYKRLLDEFGYTQENWRKLLERADSHCQYSAFGLATSAQNALEEGKLTAGHARSLIGLPNAVELAQKLLTRVFRCVKRRHWL